MNKLKKQNKINLLSYQHFLKNNSLKKQKFKFKNILFDNPIIYKNNNFNIIELNNSQNISIPTTIIDFNRINTIKTLYENQLLFNYDLTNLESNIIYNFNKIMLNFLLKKTNIIKGRMVDIVKTKKNKYKNKKVLIAVLGILFTLKSLKLNKYLKYLFIKKKKLFFKDFNKNKFNRFKNKIILSTKINNKQPLYKKVDKKITKFIETYKCRPLNFKLIKIKNKYIFSRIAYINHIIKKKRKNKQIKKFKNQSILGKVQKQFKKNLSSNLFVEPIKLKKK